MLGKSARTVSLDLRRRLVKGVTVSPSRRGELHRDAEAAGGPGGEGEGSVVRAGDAVDDRQAEADTCVVGPYASAAALKRLDERGNQRWGELLARVLDSKHDTLGLNAGCDPHGALFGHVVHDGVVHEVRSHL